MNMDITKCKGTDCPLKKTCYRFTAKPDKDYQSYFARVPYDKNDNLCEAYWEIIKDYD